LQSGGTVAVAAPSAPAASGGATSAAPPEATPALESEAIPAQVEETAPPPSPSIPGTFAEIVALFEAKREAVLHARLVRNVRPVRVEPGILEISAGPEIDTALAGALGKMLMEWTGQPWAVSISSDAGEATIVERKDAAEARVLDEASTDPVVAAVLDSFPGASVESVRPLVAGGEADTDTLLEPILDEDDDDDDDGPLEARVIEG
jgi:DNA polymerase-3 subunit gamma/tau